MKAITLTQPWATLVAIGAKKIETRSWPTAYRGPIAIHAAQKFPGWAKDCAQNSLYFRNALGWPDPSYFQPTPNPKNLEVTQGWLDDISARLKALPLGYIIGTTEILDCRKTEVIASPSFENTAEFLFGDYAPGRYGFYLGPVTALAKPIPATGALGIWEWRGSGIKAGAA